MAKVKIDSSSHPHMAAQKPWQDAPFSLYATNESLADVLRKFAVNFNLQTDVDPALQGVVTGKFSLVAAGLAFLAGALIASHFGV